MQSVSEAPAPRPETRNGDSGGVARGQSSDFGWQRSTGAPHFLFPPLQPPSSLVAGPQDPLWRKVWCYGDARSGARESWTETWHLGQRRCTGRPPVVMCLSTLPHPQSLLGTWNTAVLSHAAGRRCRAEERGMGNNGRWPSLQLQGLPPDSGHNKFSQG